MIKGRFRALALFAVSFLAFGRNELGFAAYPDHPVHIIVANGTGGDADRIARLLASKLTEKWGQPVIVENKPGASEAIGGSYVAHSAPDGYTILEITNTSLAAAITQKLDYDLMKSLDPVTLAIRQYGDALAINPSVIQVNNLGDLISYAKTHPGKLNYAGVAQWSITNLEMLQFNQVAGINVVGVPYLSSAQAMTALLGGEVAMRMIGQSQVLEQGKSGKIRALAVAGSTRSGTLPDIPTFAETPAAAKFTGIRVWDGFLTPANTPKEIVDKIQRDFAEVLKAPDIERTFTNVAQEVVVSTPEQFSDTMKNELIEFTKLIKG